MEQLLFEFNLGTPLSELAAHIGRTPYGVALKVRELSREYPDTWNPRKVAGYTRGEIKRHKGDTSGGLVHQIIPVS